MRLLYKHILTKSYSPKPLKISVFKFFKFWSVKYTHIVVTSSNYIQALILAIVNRFTKFDCQIKSITAAIKILKRPIFRGCLSEKSADVSTGTSC